MAGRPSITGRCKDCSPLGWDTPYTKRTGNAGVVRDLIKGADIAAANFENPAPNNPRFHASGTNFSADPRLIDGLANAGIDYVSLANNHIRDAGATGLLQTITNVKKRGIAVLGRGQERERSPHAGHPRGGRDEGRDPRLRRDRRRLPRDRHQGRQRRPVGQGRQGRRGRRRARPAPTSSSSTRTGAPSTTRRPFANQKKLAEMIIDNGADMVIGNHAHWAAAMEVYKGKPIWYALGNFVFDQTWSEPTMEGITLELTFRGKDLVQVRIRPHIILDKAQPNFLDPAGAGKVVMGQVFSGVEGPAALVGRLGG